MNQLILLCTIHCVRSMLSIVTIDISSNVDDLRVPQ